MHLQATLSTGDNIAGAIIFFSYIAAALSFTGLIIADILSMNGPKEDRKHDNKMSNAGINASNDQRIEDLPDQISSKKDLRKIFPVAASISFAVLSWNMLRFLITSYIDWWHMQGAPSPGHLFTVSGFRQILNLIWIWATNSSLFQTFAEDLMLSQEAWRTTQLALLYSYTSNLWMSLLGFQYGLPHLWTYFVLDQILPVSFTQNLFCTAITLYTSRTSSYHRAAKTLWPLRIVATVSYVVLLLSMPATLHTNWFFSYLFTLRSLLLAPFLIDFCAFYRQSEHDASYNRKASTMNKWCSLILLLAGVYGVFADAKLLLQRSRPTTRNFAAAALSDDMLIGILSGLIYIFAGPR